MHVETAAEINQEPKELNALSSALRKEVQDAIDNYDASWARSDENCKATMAKECQSKLVYFAFELARRKDARSMASELDLCALNKFFGCLQKHGIYQYLKEGSEEAFLKHNPYLASWEVKAKVVAERDKNRRNAIYQHWAPNEKTAEANYDASAAATHKAQMDEITEGRSVDWILQLHNLSRKVDRQAAERAILSVLSKTDKRYEVVIAHVLAKANRLIFDTLLKHGVNSQSHHTDPFKRREQADYSFIILEAIALPEKVRLTEIWKVVYPAPPLSKYRRRRAAINRKKSINKQAATAKAKAKVIANKLPPTPEKPGWSAVATTTTPEVPEVESAVRSEPLQRASHQRAIPEMSVAGLVGPSLLDNEWMVDENMIDPSKLFEAQLKEDCRGSDTEQLFDSDYASGECLRSPTPESMADDESNDEEEEESASSVDSTAMKFSAQPLSLPSLSVGNMQVTIKKEATASWQEEIPAIASSNNERDFFSQLVKLFEKYFEFQPVEHHNNPQRSYRPVQQRSLVAAL